jgi:hypothetical protein
MLYDFQMESHVDKATEEFFAFDDDNIYNSLDECLNDTMDQNGEMFPLSQVIHGRKRPARKRVKTEDLKPIVFVRLNTRHGKAKAVTLRALLDSGGSGSLVTEQFTKKLRTKVSSASTVWMTPGGALKTNTKCKVQFTIPELHDARLVEWDMYVTKSLGAYDMIIG